MHPLVDQAKKNLEIVDERDTYLSYSGRFTPYNANVRADRYELEVRLSKEWKRADDDIVVGLIEHLLSKLFRKRMKTARMQLYKDYLLYIGRTIEKDVEDAKLMAAFQRVNKKYFGGEMELASIKWGRGSFYRLGYYHYGSDTITLSPVLAADERFLDYVLYHELLHKKHGLTRGGHAHTRAFKQDEAKYSEASERELSAFLAKQKRKLF